MMTYFVSNYVFFKLEVGRGTCITITKVIKMTSPIILFLCQQDSPIIYTKHKNK